MSATRRLAPWTHPPMHGHSRARTHITTTAPTFDMLAEYVLIVLLEYCFYTVTLSQPPLILALRHTTLEWL